MNGLQIRAMKVEQGGSCYDGKTTMYENIVTVNDSNKLFPLKLSRHIFLVLVGD
jgi:hypothetical protein